MQVDIINLALPAPLDRTPRSRGVHLSNVIRVIGAQNGSLKPEYVESLDLVDASTLEWWGRLTLVNQLRVAIGLAWEEWYLPQLAPLGIVDHPGEMERDGIYMTHDGESIDVLRTERGENQMVLALHEVKTTYKSTRTVGDSLSRQWMLLSQAKGYCKGLNTLLAYIHMLFICGDYSYPISPLLRIYKIIFTQAEVDDNWDVITSYVEHHRQQLAEDSMRGTT